MRLLIVDPNGLGLDFALRCMKDGHKVKWYIRQVPKNLWIGRGLADIVDDYKKWLMWADMVFLTDNTAYLAEIDAFGRANPDCMIIGPSVASAALELDRDEGMKMFRKHGVEIPPYKTFSKYDPAIAYVKKEMRRFVSKPCGDEPDKSLSYVAKTPADMVYMLERWKKAKRHKGAFVMQDFCGGIEMAVGGWLGPYGFRGGWCENWEFKKLMVGDLGVATGEQGTILRQVKKSKLADMVLKPMEEDLIALGHTGYVDVNCIIAEDGTPYPLEWTMRPGWPLFNIQQALVEGDHAEWLAHLYAGRDVPLRQNVNVCGVVMAIPDYPYSHLTRKEVVGIPVYLEPGMLETIAPCEMMMGEAPQEVNGKIVTMPTMVTAGDYVLVSWGTGETVREAQRGAYKTLKEITIPNSPMYRVDIGNRLKKQLPELQKHGFALGMTF